MRKKRELSKQTAKLLDKYTEATACLHLAIDHEGSNPTTRIRCEMDWENARSALVKRLIKLEERVEMFKPR